MTTDHMPGVSQIISERRWLFAGVLAGFVLAVAIVTAMMTPIYSAKTIVLLGKEGSEQKIAFVTAQNPFRSQSDVNSEYQQLRSRALAEAVASRLLALEEAPEVLAAIKGGDRARSDWLLGHTRVRPLEGSDVVEIQAYAPDRAAAMEIVNAYAEVYVDQSRDRARAKIREVREFLSDQVESMQARLQVGETDLRNFQQRTGVTSLPDETKALVDQLAQAETSYQQTSAELSAHRERHRLLSEQLRVSQEGLVDRVPEVNVPVIARLRSDLADRMAYRETFLAQGYDSSHVKLREMEGQISEIKGRLLQSLEGLRTHEGAPTDPLAQVQDLSEELLREEVEIASLEARFSALGKSIEGYSTRLATLPQKSFELGQLAYNTDVDQRMLMMLQQRYEEARIEEAGLKGSAMIIDRAVIPARPVRPDYRLSIPLALILGSVLATIACLIAHRLNHRVRSVTDAERLTGWSACGHIPEITLRDLREGSACLRSGPFRKMYVRRRLKQVIASGGLATSLAPWSPVRDAYRALRIRLSRMTDPLAQTILVTSPGPGDGKTMTACNLALALAEGGKRVLLIEADLHRPQILSRFGMTAHCGLGDLLAGRCEAASVILQSGVGNLHILPGGDAGDAAHELLTGPRMPSALEWMKANYDHVVIDTPPLIPVADATVLSILADATLVVVRSNHTELDMLAHSSQVLRSLGIPVSGIVFNGDRRPVGGNRYYQYYQAVRRQPRLAPAVPIPHLPSGVVSEEDERKSA